MPSLTVEDPEAQPFRINAEHSVVNVELVSPQQKQCSMAAEHAPKQQVTTGYLSNGNASGNSNGIAYRQVPPHPATALEQYRLQLYNYALNIERLRCPQYSAAATAMAAAAAYANNNGGSAAPVNNVHYLPHAAATNRLAALSSISLFPQRIFQPEEPKPQHSYIGLIAMAILSTSDLKLVLSDIYQYILDNYPYFRSRGPGWRNSIRHNLSLNDCFIKSGRSANGKGHYWAIHPANMEDFRKGDFRRRKAQRKVRKHMGLSVDDAGMDSPSPPPLDLTAPPPASQVAMQQLAAFGYPYHQHYIGQFFGRNVVAGGLSHYATLHRGQHPQLAAPQQQQQHHQQQQQTSQHQQPVVQQPQQDNHPPAHQHVAYINSTTTTTIANLYSQTRKRQFDMASLLAPDVQLIDVEKNLEPPAATRTTTTTETQHTVITKVSVQQHRELLVELDEHEVEVDADIDVVDASDVEEDNEPPVEFRASKKSIGDLGVDDNLSYLSDGRRSSFEVEPDADADTESFLPQVENSRINSMSPLLGVATEIRKASAIYAGSLSSNSSHHDSTSLGECPVAAESQHRHQPSPSPQPLQETHTELNHMDPHIFGRYYGSYMAAAAARRIGLATTSTSSSMPQSQNVRSPH